MLKLLMNISSVVFLVCAVTYLPLFFRFQSDLKGAVQKSPDLFNINGLGEAVRLISIYPEGRRYRRGCEHKRFA
jgi:hypothetical protein